MSDLVCEKQHHVAVIKLNRPDRMNAISTEMLTALGENLAEFDKDPSVRAIILTGEGRGFCSGLDLKDTAAGKGLGGSLVGRRRIAHQHPGDSYRDAQSHRCSGDLRD